MADDADRRRPGVRVRKVRGVLTSPWFGDFILGRWADHVVHADPCDCDHDDERTGDRCMDASGGRTAVLQAGGAFPEQLVVVLPSHEELNAARDDDTHFVAVRADEVERDRTHAERWRAAQPDPATAEIKGWRS